MLNVLVQQARQTPKSLQFHPWQSPTPDGNTSGVDAAVVISTGGVTEDATLALSAYRLFLANSTDEGTPHAALLIMFTQCAVVRSPLMLGKQHRRRYTPCMLYLHSALLCSA